MAAFASGFAIGELVGFDRLLGYARRTVSTAETWISTAQAQPSTAAGTMSGKVVGITDGDTLYASKYRRP